MIYSQQVKKQILCKVCYLTNIKNFFPIKTHKVSSDDQPWITHKLKAQDRRKKRELNKHRKSEKWYKMSKESTVQGDLPAKLYKEFAAYISEPLTHVFNTSLIQGECPQI